MSLVNIIIGLILVYWAVICLYSKKDIYYSNRSSCSLKYNKLMHFLFIVIINSYFFGSNFLTLSRIIIFSIFSIHIFLLRKWNFYIDKTIVRLYVIFYLWLIFTLTYSTGIEQGLLMLGKYAIPFVFLVFSYHALQNEKEYILWLRRINRLNIIYIVVHGIAPIGKAIDIVASGFFEGEYGYSMAIFVTIPITLYVLTKKKIYLFEAFLYVVPAATYMRRAALGAYFLTLGVFILYKYKLKGAVVSVILLLGIIISIFAVEPLKERFFGGDKGDASSLTLKDLIQGDVQINSTGRDTMWGIVYDMFFVGHEIKGSGLGSMKRYMTSDDNEYKDAFMILHNDYLHLACETGAVGVTLWLFFYLAIVLKVRNGIRRIQKTIVVYSGLSALCGFVAIAFVMFFANVVSSPFLFVQPFILFGFFLKIVKLHKLKCECIYLGK